VEVEDQGEDSMGDEDKDEADEQSHTHALLAAKR